MLAVLFIGLLLTGIGLATNTVTVQDLIIVGILLGIIGAAIMKTEKGILKNTIKRNKSTQTNSINYSFQEGKQIIKDFAQDEFKGRINKKKGISIDHTRSESEPTSIITNPKTGDVVMVRHYYVTHGDLNQPVDFFVDVTNGKYFAHKQVTERRRNARDRNPFEKLDAYRKTKRYARKVQPDSDRGVDASQLQGIPLGTFPVDQGNGGGGEG